MDVGEWLKGIGLGQYEETFRAHDIDVDVLPDVTEADLEKIGLPLEARKRLMKAIANLRPPEFRVPPEPLWTAPEPSRPLAAPSPPPRMFRPDAERRRSARSPGTRAARAFCSAWRRGGGSPEPAWLGAVAGIDAVKLAQEGRPSERRCDLGYALRIGLLLHLLRRPLRRIVEVFPPRG
jgi:hypothetical protein